jgi:hypothetical protein
MVLSRAGPHHHGMDTYTRKPRVGDRVRIKGFLGVFEVVEVAPRGSMVDVKHLDLHHPAYIEKEVLWHELIFLHGEQPAEVVAKPVSRPVLPAKKSRRIQVVPYQTEIPINRRQQGAPRLALDALPTGS